MPAGPSTRKPLPLVATAIQQTETEMTPQELNEKLEQLYHSAEAASSEGLAEEALKRCEAALELLDLNYDEECQYTHADFTMLAGHACWEDNDIEGALRYYRQSLDMDPGRIEAMLALGVALFHLCRFSAAQQYLELASVEDPDVGETWYYLGLCHLRSGRKDLAGVFFTRAHEKESERWLNPRFLSADEIEAVVREMVEQMPPELREAAREVTIILDDIPSEELLFSSDPPLDPLLLGLFDGMPLPDQSVFDAPTTVNRIYLFTDNIALIAADQERLHEELFTTLKHELGHFLGLDEDDLAARGLD